MSWIQTHIGRSFDLLNPTPEQVAITDIAHSLSHICRFTGHCREFYSVAQHSVLVMSLVPDHLKAQALLHDATEAYVGDMSWPLKQLLPEYKAIEQGVWEAIAEAYGLPTKLDPGVKHADSVALMLERRDLMPGGKHAWAPQFEEVARNLPVCIRIVPKSPREAWREFMDAFFALGLMEVAA